MSSFIFYFHLPAEHVTTSLFQDTQGRYSSWCV